MGDDATDRMSGAAAYGGTAWRSRVRSHRDDVGTLWRMCGVDSEWRELRTVLLHAPGDELGVVAAEADESLLLAPIEVARAREEHLAMTDLYRSLGVEVIEVLPATDPSPNQMFCADLFVMTPQGAILARPASVARAGEEVAVARRLAAIGVPILRTLTGDAVFEGADLMWLDETTAVVGRGPRTNQQAIDQIATTLHEIGCEVLAVDLPFGTMHLMGMLRIAAADLAVCWQRRTPHAAVEALRERGFEIVFVPEGESSEPDRAINFVTLGPRRILMVDGLPGARRRFEENGIECFASPTDELSNAAGNIGCLTGIIERETLIANRAP
ncbi:MAG: amidinotransferase [Actinomycetia bacterium]|nr:amidinotransferase [Actinomycetes bacterium]